MRFVKRTHNSFLNAHFVLLSTPRATFDINLTLVIVRGGKPEKGFKKDWEGGGIRRLQTQEHVCLTPPSSTDPRPAPATLLTPWRMLLPRLEQTR